MDVQDVLVDQAQAHEPMRGPDAAGLLLEPCDDGGQLAIAPHNDQRRNPPVTLRFVTGSARGS
jgi:hypothetical protein